MCIRDRLARELMILRTPPRLVAREPQLVEGPQLVRAPQLVDRAAFKTAQASTATAPKPAAAPRSFASGWWQYLVGSKAADGDN